MIKQKLGKQTLFIAKVLTSIIFTRRYQHLKSK